MLPQCFHKLKSQIPGRSSIDGWCSRQNRTGGLCTDAWDKMGRTVINILSPFRFQRGFYAGADPLVWMHKNYCEEIGHLSSCQPAASQFFHIFCLCYLAWLATGRPFKDRVISLHSAGQRPDWQMQEKGLLYKWAAKYHETHIEHGIHIQYCRSKPINSLILAWTPAQLYKSHYVLK